MAAISYVQLNHVSIIVPDLDAACSFFTDFLGFNHLQSTGPISADDDTINRVYGLPERAVGRMAVLELNGQKIALEEWKSWGQAINPLRESSVPGVHISIRVADLDAAVNTLSTIPRIRFLERSPNGFVYCATPYGFQLRLGSGNYNA